jgi:hypothetical protein
MEMIAPEERHSRFPVWIRPCPFVIQKILAKIYHPVYISKVEACDLPAAATTPNGAIDFPHNPRANKKNRCL